MKKIEKLELSELNRDPFRNGFASMMEHGEKIKDKRRNLYRQLWDCMMRMDGYYQTLSNNHITPRDLEEMAYTIQSRLMAALRPLKYGTDFLPVALISLGQPLDYLAPYKKVIIDNQSSDVMVHIFKAISLL